MAEFFQGKKRMFLVTGALCLVVLCGLLLTNPLTKQVSVEIGDYTMQIPSEWKITVGEAELIFEKNNIPIGGVQIVGYEPDQPLFLPNHSETKWQEKIEGLFTKAVLVNLDLTQPAASGDTSVKNENHLYLLFPNIKIAYDIYAHTRYVNKSELVKIAKSFKKREETRKPKSIDKAVSIAIKNRGKNGYLEGEVATEGHLILDTEERNGKIIVYTISSFGYFGFENGIFTKISGSGAIPTVISFSKNEKGEYTLLEYKEPVDGAGYTDSLKKMFPSKLWDKVFSAWKYYPELARQQETQAGEYLKALG